MKPKVGHELVPTDKLLRHPAPILALPSVSDSGTPGLLCGTWAGLLVGFNFQQVTKHKGLPDS